LKKTTQSTGKEPGRAVSVQSAWDARLEREKTGQETVGTCQRPDATGEKKLHKNSKRCLRERGAEEGGVARDLKLAPLAKVQKAKTPEKVRSKAVGAVKNTPGRTV